MTPSALEIARALPEDAAVVPLVKDYPESVVPGFGEYGKSYASLIEAEGTGFWLARSGGSVVGFVLAFHHPSLFNFGQTTWIEELFVAKRARSQGIGSSWKGSSLGLSSGIRI